MYTFENIISIGQIQKHLMIALVTLLIKRFYFINTVAYKNYFKSIISILFLIEHFTSRVRLIILIFRIKNINIYTRIEDYLPLLIVGSHYNSNNNNNLISGKKIQYEMYDNMIVVEILVLIFQRDNQFLFKCPQ